MHVSLSEVPGILAENVKTTMVYIDVLNSGGRGVRSALDSVRKAVSSESDGIIRTGRPAKKWEGIYGTRGKSLQIKWLPSEFGSATSSY